jgi:hypothetical protein
MNHGTAAAAAQVQFYDGQGQPLTVPVKYLRQVPVVPGAVPNFTLEAGSTVTFETDRPDQPTWTGSAQLWSTGYVTATAVFRHMPSGQEATIPLQTSNPTLFAVPFDNTAGFSTGLAIANPQIDANSVDVPIRDESGAVLGTSKLTLSARGQTSFVLAERFTATAGKRGTIEFAADASVQSASAPMKREPTRLCCRFR